MKREFLTRKQTNKLVMCFASRVAKKFISREIYPDVIFWKPIV